MQKEISLKKWAKPILLGLVYFITGKIGLMLASVNASTTAIWAPTGIAIAGFLLFGYRIWPAIYLGAFLINLTTTGHILSSVGIALGNTLEGLVAGYLINTFANGKNTFYKAQDIFKFVVLAAFLSTIISANIGVLSLILSGLASWNDFNAIWLTWWMGDATGALLVTPFILFWRARHPLQLLEGKKLEIVLLALTIMLVGIIVFGGYVPGIVSGYSIEFLCIPTIIWVAFRFGRRETITAIMLLAVIAIWGTLNGYGPFALSSQNESLLLLQSFMAVTTITALSLAVAVSERRKVEEALSYSEQRFKALTEKSSEAISLTDPDGIITYVSPSFTNILGYPPSEMIGKSGFSIIHPDDVDYATETTSKIIGNSNKSITIAIRCKHQDKSYRYIEITSTNLLDNPSVKAIVSNFHDITEIVKTEERIMNEKLKADALINSIGDGLVATDSEGKVILINKAFEELLGWKAEDLLGKKSAEKLPMENERGASISEKDRPITLALRTGKKIISTNFLVRKDKTKFPAIITATPIIQNKKTIGAIKVFHDITHEKEIEDMKTEFISIASHELRTPLSAIKGFVSMINEGDYGKMDDRLKRPLELVAASTQRLINIVNEMLDVSRIEANRVQLNFANYNISDLINELILSLKPLFDKKNIELKVLPGDKLEINADKEKVIEILNNLVGNALKFTEKGNVIISYKIDSKKVVVYVKDTGLGIKQTDIQKLFNRFEQLKSKKAGNVAGTGLGLYISREYARKMGGDVWVESSTVGKGSTFAFSIPSTDVK